VRTITRARQGQSHRITCSGDLTRGRTTRQFYGPPIGAGSLPETSAHEGRTAGAGGNAPTVRRHIGRQSARAVTGLCGFNSRRRLQMIHLVTALETGPRPRGAQKATNPRPRLVAAGYMRQPLRWWPLAEGCGSGVFVVLVGTSSMSSCICSHHGTRVACPMPERTIEMPASHTTNTKTTTVMVVPPTQPVKLSGRTGPPAGSPPGGPSEVSCVTAVTASSSCC